ncbi:MAG: hypothetical protein UV36_C0013G0007, partial [Parcubacteria group bacterium GW2011_GWC2_42_6]
MVGQRPLKPLIGVRIPVSEHMNLSNRKKIIIYISAAVATLIILTIIGLRLWIWRAGVEMCAGRIVEMDDKSFIVENRRGEKMTILISPETEILEGRKCISGQSLVGEEIFVVG